MLRADFDQTIKTWAVIQRIHSWFPGSQSCTTNGKRNCTIVAAKSEEKWKRKNHSRRRRESGSPLTPGRWEAIEQKPNATGPLQPPCWCAGTASGKWWWHRRPLEFDKTDGFLKHTKRPGDCASASRCSEFTMSCLSIGMSLRGLYRRNILRALRLHEAIDSRGCFNERRLYYGHTRAPRG